MSVSGSAAVTTGAFIERFVPGIVEVAPIEQSAPVPFWKFGTSERDVPARERAGVVGDDERREARGRQLVGAVQA